MIILYPSPSYDSISIHFFKVLIVTANYEVQVHIHSFTNPNGSCADIHCLDNAIQGCCESGGCPSSCHYYFSLCLRPADTPVSMLGLNNQSSVCLQLINTNIGLATDGASFEESIYGTPNPIVLIGPGVPWVSQCGPVFCAFN